MDNGGQTADQVVRMSLQGIEVAAQVTMKIGESAAKTLAATLYAILTDKKKVKGKTRLNTLLKSGKELKVYALRNEDLKLFCEEAKRYGVLYCVLKEKNNKDGICDIMVRAEDAAKISRIVDKFELAIVDTKAIREAIMNDRAQKETNKSEEKVKPMSMKEHDDLVESLMSSTKKAPDLARTKGKENPSEQPSKKKEMPNSRPSVRKRISELKQQQKVQKQVDVKIPRRKKKKGKSR